MANLHSEMRITDTTVISHLKSARSVPQFALPSGAGSIWGKGGATAEPKRLLRTVDHIQGANLEYQFTLLGDPSSSPRPPVPKHSRWTRRLRSSASLSNRWRPFPADALSRPPGGRAGGRTVPLRVHNEVTRNQHGGGSWTNGHRRPKGDGALPRAPPPACGGRLAASKTTWRDPASRSAPLRSAFGDLVRRPQCWQLSAGQSPEARRTTPPTPQAGRLLGPRGHCSWPERRRRWGPRGGYGAQVPSRASGAPRGGVPRELLTEKETVIGRMGLAALFRAVQSHGAARPGPCASSQRQTRGCDSRGAGAPDPTCAQQLQQSTHGVDRGPASRGWCRGLARPRAGASYRPESPLPAGGL